MVDKNYLINEWKPYINKLEIRKNEWSKKIKNESSLFKFLKDNIYK